MWYSLNVRLADDVVFEVKCPLCESEYSVMIMQFNSSPKGFFGSTWIVFRQNESSKKSQEVIFVVFQTHVAACVAEPCCHVPRSVPAVFAQAFAAFSASSLSFPLQCLRDQEGRHAPLLKCLPPLPQAQREKPMAYEAILSMILKLTYVYGHARKTRTMQALTRN